VVFSQRAVFIDENDSTPDQAQRVVYYSLAIGHHLGVIDCLETALSCPWEEYLAWIAHAPLSWQRRAQDGAMPKYWRM
jgi:formate hydrogenlyase maturation protein HycH